MSFLKFPSSAQRSASDEYSSSYVDAARFPQQNSNRNRSSSFDAVIRHLFEQTTAKENSPTREAQNFDATKIGKYEIDLPLKWLDYVKSSNDILQIQNHRHPLPFKDKDAQECFIKELCNLIKQIYHYKMAIPWASYHIGADLLRFLEFLGNSSRPLVLEKWETFFKNGCARVEFIEVGARRIQLIPEKVCTFTSKTYGKMRIIRTWEEVATQSCNEYEYCLETSYFFDCRNEIPFELIQSHLSTHLA